MRLVLLGPPGAGKGTLCRKLKENFDLLHISTGDLLREEMKNKTNIGVEIKEVMDSGNLVSDKMVSQIVREHLVSAKRDNMSFLLDGFPRTKHQAIELENILKEINAPLDLVLFLESTPGLIIKRLTGRRVCQNCRAIFHIKNRPPRVEGICDYCGEANLVQRKDDTEETILHRMSVYIDTINPLLNYYDEQQLVKRVDSDRNPEDVQEDLLKFINE
ncbi:MAG: adenylate kinase [Candidatus Omnitrophota bacterium]|jgi:adenylate kinase